MMLGFYFWEVVLFNGINKVILVGYLGSDPESVSFSDKKAFVRASVATSSLWKNNKTQDWVKKVEWHQVLFYNKWVSIVEKYLKKGTQVYVECFLITDKFEKNGFTVFSTKIICSSLLLLDKSDSRNVSEEMNENLTLYEDEETEPKKEINDIPF